MNAKKVFYPSSVTGLVWRFVASSFSILLPIKKPQAKQGETDSAEEAGGCWSE